MNDRLTRTSRASPRRRAASAADHAQREVDEAGHEDQPEVRGVVLPPSIDLGPAQQDEEAE